MSGLESAAGRRARITAGPESLARAATCTRRAPSVTMHQTCRLLWPLPTFSISAHFPLFHGQTKHAGSFPRSLHVSVALRALCGLTGQSGCKTPSAESNSKQGAQAACLCRQALVEGFEVAAQGAAARHEHGLAVPPVHGAVPEGSKALVRCIQPLPLLSCSACT